MKFGKIIMLHTWTHRETNKTFSHTAVYKIVNAKVQQKFTTFHSYRFTCIYQM